MKRIGQDDSDECPDCKVEEHDTGHLFKCPKKPTSLTVESLWTDPVGAALFLGLDTIGEGHRDPKERANQSINQSVCSKQG